MAVARRDPSKAADVQGRAPADEGEGSLGAGGHGDDGVRIWVESEGGVRIYAEARGPSAGAPVAFLHGVTASARAWEFLPDEVCAGRRIIRLDFRGHGRSGHAPGRYRVCDYAGDVAAVLGELSPERPAVLVGHSLGGTVAWWLAQRRPELVAAAFLEDPPLLQGEMGAPENAPTRARFRAMRAAVLADRAAGRDEQAVAARLAATRAGAWPDAPLLGELVFAQSIAAMAFAQLRLDIGVIDGAIDGSTLAGLDARTPVARPVYILRADERYGGVLTDERARKLAELQPQVELAQVQGAGHGIHDERDHRAVFLAHLHRFLDRHAPRG